MRVLQDTLREEGDWELAPEKTECIVSVIGTGGQKLAQDILNDKEVPGSKLRTVRYLGPRIQDSNLLDEEMQHRLTAAAHCWGYLRGAVREGRLPVRRLGALLRAIVGSTLVSALKVRVLSKKATATTGSVPNKMRVTIASTAGQMV